MTADKKVKAMRVAMDSLVPAISAKKETIVRCYELRSFQLFELLGVPGWLQLEAFVEV